MSTKRRSRRGEPEEPPPLGVGTSVYAAWMTGSVWLKAVIKGEDVHKTEGHRWNIKYLDGKMEWLPDQYVRVNAKGSSSAPQVASPPTGAGPKKKQKPAPTKKTDEKSKTTPKRAATVPPVPDPEVQGEADVPAADQEVKVPNKEPDDTKDAETEEDIKPIVPFCMGNKGLVLMPVQLMWALADEITDERSFQQRRKGDQKKAQLDALEHHIHAMYGFSIRSPLYDVLNRGCKMVRNDATGKVHYLNQLSENGIDYYVEYLTHKGNRLPFGNVRECTVRGTSEVSINMYTFMH